MKLSSPVFEHEEFIPKKYTCDGENINPPLIIEDAPEGTLSFAIIMDDPDVPAEVRPEQMWDHWIVFNIAPDTVEISENTNPGIQGKGSYDHFDYGGPCPPPQYQPTTHRYFFKLYALNTMLELKQGATKKEVELAMQGHILKQTSLMGKYDRSKQ
jgi:Raf kinase inhibitor-like YbhB/YbcL family protein